MEGIPKLNTYFLYFPTEENAPPPSNFETRIANLTFRFETLNGDDKERSELIEAVKEIFFEFPEDPQVKFLVDTLSVHNYLSQEESQLIDLSSKIPKATPGSPEMSEVLLMICKLTPHLSANRHFQQLVANLKACYL